MTPILKCCLPKSIILKHSLFWRLTLKCCLPMRPTLECCPSPMLTPRCCLKAYIEMFSASRCCRKAYIEMFPAYEAYIEMFPAYEAYIETFPAYEAYIKMFPAYEAHWEGSSTVVNDPPGTRLPGILLHAASGRLLTSFTQVQNKNRSRFSIYSSVSDVLIFKRDWAHPVKHIMTFQFRYIHLHPTQ